MKQHTHGGIITIVFAGVSALLVFNLVKIGAAVLIQHPGTEGVGKTVGSLVSFPGS